LGAKNRGLQPKEKALHPPSASAAFFIVQSLQKQAFDGFPIKNPGAFAPELFLCSGGSAKNTLIVLYSYFTENYLKY